MYYIGHDIIINIEVIDLKFYEEIKFKLLSPASNEFTDIQVDHELIEYDDLKIIKIRINSDVCTEFGEYNLHMKIEDKLSIFKKFNVAIPPNSYRAQLETTILCGYVNSISGKPSSLNKRYLITARPKDLPILLDKNFISGESIHTYSDSNGYFELAVAKGINIVFEIPEVPIRFHYFVPPDSETSIDVSETWKNMLLGIDKKKDLRE